jgi:hypothetical protein
MIRKPLRSAKVIYVRSTSLLVGASVVEEKLQRRPEFQQLGLLLTRDEGQVDLILELKHDLFTMYVFTAIDRNTKVVVASGKLSSLGGKESCGEIFEAVAACEASSWNQVDIEVTTQAVEICRLGRWTLSPTQGGMPLSSNSPKDQAQSFLS